MAIKFNQTKGEAQKEKLDSYDPPKVLVLRSETELHMKRQNCRRVCPWDISRSSTLSAFLSRKKWTVKLLADFCSGSQLTHAAKIEAQVEPILMRIAILWGCQSGLQHQSRLRSNVNSMIYSRKRLNE